MHKTTINLSDVNFTKINNHKKILSKKSIGKITFGDALNNLLDSIK